MRRTEMRAIECYIKKILKNQDEFNQQFDFLSSKSPLPFNKIIQ